MSTFALAIWGVTLLVVALVLVPVAVLLLARALGAARAIERYLAESGQAGAGIAAHTGAIPVLEDTIRIAQAAQGVAPQLEQHSAAIAGILGARAGGGSGR